ncbi:MAG: ATP-dependent protease ATPase subunit HslU [Spirochaetales bacterium]|jgi:ATP-dependent HslUV protease ATP-binding subunit HslU|nr:ATP-dependent protease ATPase subunit HslU [Spirochaetales bacterium]
MKLDIDQLTPRQIVAELDKFVIGQEKAKKAVAIALRNRTRRQKLAKELRDEISPKNIIMIGPTGVGKTEIARRLSKLCGAPFLKVEATKYTEVGYVGRDVESMIRDLMSVSVSMVKNEMQEQILKEAEKRTEDALLDLLLPGIKRPGPSVPAKPGFAPEGSVESPAEPPAESGGSDATRDKFREKLKAGELEDKKVEVSVTKGGMPSIEIFSGTTFEEMDVNLGNISNMFGGKKKKKLVSVKNARDIILAEEMDKLIDSDRVNDLAKERVEEMGIIFIDEIDKIASKESRSGADVSREGVQRDILPIIEGNQVNTRHGMIDTSHILFIAAGAFHMSKPSDLIPELQGRFPIRVELDDLDSDDFQKILTQPENSLTLQYVELLKTEGLTIDFKDDAIRRISEIAAEVNSNTENIGARRLHTVMELLLEDVSFHAPELTEQTITITSEYVDQQLKDVVEDQDLSQYIL